MMTYNRRSKLLILAPPPRFQTPLPTPAPPLPPQGSQLPSPHSPPCGAFLPPLRAPRLPPPPPRRSVVDDIMMCVHGTIAPTDAGTAAPRPWAPSSLPYTPHPVLSAPRLVLPASRPRTRRPLMSHVTQSKIEAFHPGASASKFLTFEIGVETSRNLYRNFFKSFRNFTCQTEN